MAAATGHLSVAVLKNKWKVVRAAFARLYSILNEVVSKCGLDNRDDSKVWADFELLLGADELAKLDEEFMNCLLQEDTGEEELDKEM